MQAAGAKMKMKCMADGGLVGTIKGLFSSGPAETVTQKYARQDAENKAKWAASTPATPAPTPAPQVNAISDYAGMGAMQRREAAAGMKNGGKVKGPGTATSDSVPIMASKGEYVMPADTVRHFGVKTLDAMRKATHTPVKAGAKRPHPDAEGKKEDAAEPKGMEKREAKMPQPDAESTMEDQAEPAGAEQTEVKGFGARKADGGQIGPIEKGGFHRWLGKKQGEPITQADIGKGLASKDQHVRKMAQFAANARQFDHPKKGYADGGLVTPAPTPAPLPTPGNLFTFRVPTDVKNSVDQGLNAIRGPAPVGGAAPSLGDTVSARLNGADTPAPAGAATVTPANPADMRLASGTATTPLDSGSRPLPDGMTPSAAGAGRGSVNPPPAAATGDARPDLANVPSLGGSTGTAVAGAAGVRKFVTPDGRTLYSNVAGADNDKLMSSNPGMQIVPSFGAGQPGTATANATGSGAGGSSDALSAARSAAAARGDFQAVSDSYGGNFAGGQYAANPVDNSIQGQIAAQLASGRKLTAAGARALSDASRVAGENRRGDAATVQGAQKLAMETQTHSQDASVKAAKITLDTQMANARSQYLAAKPGSPEQDAAEEQLRVLSGTAAKIFPELYSTTAIPGGVDPVTGQMRGAGAIITDKRTGKTQILSADQVRGQPAAQQYETGKVYQDANGKKATWDGSKFVPA